MTLPGDHVAPDRLEAFARYEPRFGPPALDGAERAHLVACATCRERLARIEPTAEFGLLGWLPEAEPLPPRPALPGRASPALRVAAGLAAAALVAGLALLTVARPPAVPVDLAAAGERADTWPGIVRRVESDTATVVTLVPPGADGPTVTLILDEDLDL